jgi:hypothetical protein
MAEAAEYWSVIELMGHVRMAGKVSEVERFGAKCGRIDIPDGDGFKTQFFGGNSIYRETPCTEEVARAIAARCMPQPINAWEMPQRPAFPESTNVIVHPAGTFPRDADSGGNDCDDDVDVGIPF